MYELIFSYLLIITVLFGVNMGFFYSFNKLTNKSMFIISIVLSLSIFVLSLVGNYLSSYFLFVHDYLDLLFLIEGLILFLMSFIFISNYKKNISSSMPLIIANLSLVIFIFIFNTQLDHINYSNIVLSALLLFIIMLISFNVFKLLIYAKRPFSILIGEYMILEAILIFCFGLTFDSVKSLDYAMFNSFLILTPTYQLIYLAIGIIALLLLGLYLNNEKMKKKFN
ncbi:hypothetical protein [Methanobrevibacter sp. DSM 116169]|uniref:hypothetical protein n=1 Tax=Methanobrevibacter sp. DSM 116169 TaxID=3242727 RepID=UPI0038FC390E